MQHTHSQHGFAHIVSLIVVVLVIGVAGLIIWRLSSVQSTPTTSTTEAVTTPPPSGQIIMKSIGFTLDDYNEATNRAGDMQFTKTPLMFDQIWGDFGQQDPRSPNDPTKRNPQPTYILPLGTKVQSLVDGKVAEVKQIYSGDYSIMVKPDGTNLLFETEHVDNPLVKIGDTVKSGQVIAEVSKHDSQNHPGFGLLEIGVLGQEGSRPVHTCPYQYLDASVKDDLLKKITNVHSAWEKYLGKTVYPKTYELPGCVTLDPYKE